MYDNIAIKMNCSLCKTLVGMRSHQHPVTKLENDVAMTITMMTVMMIMVTTMQICLEDDKNTRISIK